MEVRAPWRSPSRLTGMADADHRSSSSFLICPYPGDPCLQGGGPEIRGSGYCTRDALSFWRGLDPLGGPGWSERSHSGNDCQRGILTTASLQSPTGIGISWIYSEALSVACNSNLWFVGHKTPSFPGRGKKEVMIDCYCCFFFFPLELFLMQL